MQCHTAVCCSPLRRSHCVFTCTLESKTTDASGTTNILFSRLHLVDLAGVRAGEAVGAGWGRVGQGEGRVGLHSSLLCYLPLLNTSRKVRCPPMTLCSCGPLLAGSERQKASGAQGERLREASSINKSLSTLGGSIH